MVDVHKIASFTVSWVCVCVTPPFGQTDRKNCRFFYAFPNFISKIRKFMLKILVNSVVYSLLKSLEP